MTMENKRSGPKIIATGDAELDRKREQNRKNKQAERARKAAQPRVARRPSPGKNATVSGGAESVEQFLARGGSVERLPGIKSSPVYLPRRPVLALRGAKSP